MGLWNAVFGIWLLHGQQGGVASAAPHLAAGETDAPITSRVALAMTVRNEDPLRSYQRLAVMRASLDATDVCAHAGPDQVDRNEAGQDRQGARQHVVAEGLAEESPQPAPTAE